MNNFEEFLEEKKDNRELEAKWTDEFLSDLEATLTEVAARQGVAKIKVGRFTNKGNHFKVELTGQYN